MLKCSIVFSTRKSGKSFKWQNKHLVQMTWNEALQSVKCTVVLGLLCFDDEMKIEGCSISVIINRRSLGLFFFFFFFKEWYWPENDPSYYNIPGISCRMSVGQVIEHGIIFISSCDDRLVYILGITTTKMFRSLN